MYKPEFDLPGMFAFGAMTALIGLLASILPWTADQEANLGLNWLFQLRGPRPAPAETIVITLDHNSFERFVLPTNKPERWPRAYHARLVDKLADAGVITFDIHFSESKNFNEDSLFAAAIRKAGNVALFESLERRDIGSSIVEQRNPAIAELSEAAFASAPFPLPKVPKRVSQYWLFKHSAGDAPTLPVVAFHIYTLAFYDNFLNLLKQISPQDAAALPDSAETIRRQQNIAELVNKLRILLRNNQALSHKMLERLAATNVDLRTRRILSAWIDIHSGDNSRYLDFYGPPHTIPMVSYHDALSGNILKGAGKAIFVGFLEERNQTWQKDGFTTVFSQRDGIELSGVEIAATIFNNLLENRSIRPLSAAHSFGLITIWGLIVGLLYISTPMLIVPSVTVLAFAYTGLAWYLFERNGLWLPIVTPLLLQLPLALLLALLLHYFRGRNLRKIFNLYVFKEIVDQAARGFKDFRNWSRTIHGVCLSSDAAQYTTLAETLNPDQLSALLKNYFELLFKPIEQHGGRVSDVIGDEMLALWDADSSPNITCQKACQAVFDIIAALETPTDAAKELASNAHLPTRFGLHSGVFHLSNVGAGNHYELRPVGDVVNTCSRIQGFNKQLGTQVLASADVFKHVKGIIGREVGSFRLAGKQNAQVLHELVRQGEELTDVERDQHLRFALALRLFRERQWNEAAARFEGLKKDYNDRPSRYYINLCSAYRMAPPPQTWDGVVDVTNK